MRILDSRDQVFATQDHAVSKSVVATPRNRGGNVGTRGQDAGHLFFLFEDEGAWSNIWH